MNSKVLEWFVSLALVVLLVFLINPFDAWMADMTLMVCLTVVAVLVVVFAAFVLREDASDEREIQHRMYAGRAAYLSGIGILTIALLFQGLRHNIDAWIAIALGGMVLAKLGARWYTDRFK